MLEGGALKTITRGQQMVTFHKKRIKAGEEVMSLSRKLLALQSLLPLRLFSLKNTPFKVIILLAA